MWKSVRMESQEISAVARGLLPYAMRPVKYLTTAETEALFRAIPDDRIRDRLMLDLIYRHGLRRSEAAFLRTENAQEDRIWVGRVKHGVSGEYPLHPSTKELLSKYLATRKSENPFLLNTRQSNNGKPISPSTIYQTFRKYARATGIQKENQHVHVLRHSIAVHLMNAGWGAADVQDWLGHKCISSTMIYGQVSNQRRERNHARTITSTEIARTT